jgi:hypothetical protein
MEKRVLFALFGVLQKKKNGFNKSLHKLLFTKYFITRKLFCIKFINLTTNETHVKGMS